MPSVSQVFEGDLAPSQEKGYVYLPFEVPENCTRIEVEYSYSHQIDSDPLLSGGNTIDLGVFDARGIQFLAAGFRGWSGSERLSFFITEQNATPAYLAGPLYVGTWHILLGLYKIAPEGCHYRVMVNLTSHTESAPEPSPHHFRRDLPASPVKPRQGNWLRGEMHCHTIHSDGESEPPEVVRLARERGLDFLAVTDHNSLSCQRELETLEDPGLILIRGIEVTTFKGHFNVWGIPDWVDFRVTRPAEMAAAIKYAVDHDALVSMNHPKPSGPPWDYPEVDGTHCIEVWNGSWETANDHALAFWESKLAQGKHFVAVGGSDWHNLHQLTAAPPRAPGIPTLWAYVPEKPTASAILEAVGRGHVSLSASPDGAFLELSACPMPEEVEGALYDLCVKPEDAVRAGDTLPHVAQLLVQVRCRGGAGQELRLLDQSGVVYSEKISEPDRTVMTPLDTTASLYVRAELRGSSNEMQALTNPIYFSRHPKRD